uniref:Mon2/Sec7/BIG1-like HDS domain-containing protein n=1 Tax=Parascaris equorum TaxID=6256 RepID=A0A914SJ15_PAREQ
MRSLVAASESRLQFSTQKSIALTDPACIMHRIAFIVLRLPPRPLIHLMKVWPTITDHFIQDILCGDMCSEESQDQIVSLLASFVHARPDEIGSGWRPLFGALRALRTSPLNDVFSTYLNIRNANVLAATLLDYITCVLRYLQATESNFGESYQDYEVASTALQCLLKVENMVQDLVIRADSAVPHLLHRISLMISKCTSIDASVEPSYILAPLSSVLLDDPFFESTYHSPLPADLDCHLQDSEANLKQAIGLFTEVAVTYINTTQASDSAWVDRVLLDALAVLSECAARSSERVARLGCACIRHLIKSAADSFTSRRWTIVVRSLWNTTGVNNVLNAVNLSMRKAGIGLTLAYIRLLMRYYVADSKDANGDVGRVRIAVSEESTSSHQTLLLAQQCAFNRELVLSEDSAEDIRFRSCCDIPIPDVGTARHLCFADELHR